MRTCKKCGKQHLKEGFCFFDGEFYYCSEECLYQDMTEQEYIDQYEAGNAYWTEWDDEVTDYTESALVAAKFLVDRYGFWEKEVKPQEKAIALALKDVERMETNPYSPNGKPIDKEAVNKVVDVWKKCWED